jgi:Protein of unknown function (DUF4231)
VKLFHRFPNFHPVSKEVQHIIKPADRGKYPAFAEDFEMLDRELLPSFQEFDTEAKHRQNWYRWMYIILIFGGALTTILIIVQIAFLTVPGLDIAGTLLATAVGIAITVSRSFKHHECYLNARLAAERLRSEYFLFLGHLNQYSKEQERIQKLRDRVVEIRQGVMV